MSLTGFQRYRRLQQIEEMRPENINKIQDEEAKEKIGNEPTKEELNKLADEMAKDYEENTKEEEVEIVEPTPARRGRSRK